jgi:hypothetical protein
MFRYEFSKKINRLMPIVVETVLIANRRNSPLWNQERTCPRQASSMRRRELSIVQGGRLTTYRLVSFVIHR